MEKVKKAIDAGISFPTAVKESLDQTIEDFCEKHRLIRPEFSAMIHGRRVPNDKQLNALIKTVGGTRRGWLDLWFAAAQQKAVTQKAVTAGAR
jgi:hypothetical protein